MADSLIHDELPGIQVEHYYVLQHVIAGPMSQTGVSGPHSDNGE